MNNDKEESKEVADDPSLNGETEFKIDVTEAPKTDSQLFGKIVRSESMKRVMHHPAWKGPDPKEPFSWKDCLPITVAVIYEVILIGHVVAFSLFVFGD